MMRAGKTEVTRAAAALQRAFRATVCGAAVVVCGGAAGRQEDPARGIVASGLDVLLRDSASVLDGRRAGRTTHSPHASAGTTSREYASTRSR